MLLALGKCKPKLQSHLLGCLLSNREKGRKEGREGREGEKSIEGVEKSEPLSTIGGNVKCSSWGTAWRFPKELQTELSYDLIISLLGVDPKGLKAGS